MVVGGIVVLTITVHFVSEYRFRSAMQERAALARDARIVMNHMTGVLRFAIPDEIEITSSQDVTTQIRADIAGGHLDLTGSSDEDIRYQYNPGQDTITYRQGTGGTATTIASNITGLKVDWPRDNDPEAEPDLKIEVTAGSADGSISIPLTTTIRVLPE